MIKGGRISVSQLQRKGWRAQRVTTKTGRQIGEGKIPKETFYQMKLVLCVRDGKTDAAEGEPS